MTLEDDWWREGWEQSREIGLQEGMKQREEEVIAYVTRKALAMGLSPEKVEALCDFGKGKTSIKKGE